MNNDKLYIRNCMKGFQKKRAACFDTPHNKRDKTLKKYFPESYKDIAGLPFADDYREPKERIKKSQDKAARLLGAKESFFMTDGINAGIFAMINAVKDFGVSMLINRNAPMAVYNALKVFGIEPVILNQNIKHGILLPPNADDIDKALSQNKRCIGALLSYPDRFGLTFDLSAAREKLNKAGKLLLIDGSYGAHFRFDDQTVYAGKYADIWLDGAYKTMPTLNQGVIVNVGNQDLIENLRNAVNTFRAETPNYNILASIEFAVNYMADDGMRKLENLREELTLLKKRLISTNYSVLTNTDFTVLAVDFKGVDISAKLAEKYLAGKNIYSDFCDGRYIIFRFSCSTGTMKIKLLEFFLKRITRIRKFQHTYADRYPMNFGSREKPYLSAYSVENTETVAVADATDKICASNVYSTPDGIPLVIAGEKMSEETIQTLLHQDRLYGLKNNKILVLRERNEG